MQKKITTRCYPNQKRTCEAAPQPEMRSFSVHYWCLTKKCCPVGGMERWYGITETWEGLKQGYEQIMPQCWKKCNTHKWRSKNAPICAHLHPFMNIIWASHQPKWRKNEQIRLQRCSEDQCMRQFCPYEEAIRDIWWGHHAGIKAAIDLRLNFTGILFILVPQKV